MTLSLAGDMDAVRAGDMDVEKVCRIIRELIALNESSARLARKVMVAQEVADELEHTAELALDALRSGCRVEAGRTPDQALDDAVAAFGSADSVHAEEMAASTAYAAQLGRSHRAMEAARRLIAELERDTRGAAGDAPASGRRASPHLRIENETVRDYARMRASQLN